MLPVVLRIPAPILLLLATATVFAEAPAQEPVRKILASRCWACHAQAGMGGLRLDSREAILRGGKSGPAVVPGKPEISRLIRAVKRTDSDVKAMPPQEALTPTELQTLERWIREGAAWSEETEHWSFRPLRPVPEDGTIDALIDGALRSKGLTKSRQASKTTLIRRVYFDLTGLPPGEAEFEEAADDASSEWFSKLVSRLLKSPHFGEKWGRHWLDVARYGEDDFTGTAVVPYPNAWRYRQWVLEAMNQDMPWDRFLMAQLAGDLMHDPSLLPATGLLGLGPWYYGIAQPAQSRADERHDRIDMVTRGMLGVTVACARCHDHKYDPFTQKDYYALGGVFASTGYKEYPLVSEAEADDWNARKKEADQAEKALNEFLDDQAGRLAEHFATRIADYMMATIDAPAARGLNEKILQRWKTYLSKPEEQHVFLKTWFQGNRSRVEAQKFQSLLEEISRQKEAVDKENKELVEAANKSAPKVQRTIVLPGGYRSEEDFNPGAYVPSKSLERNRFVAWNRIFGDKTAPLKIDRELAAEILEPEFRPKYELLKNEFEQRKKSLPPKYPFLHGAAEFDPLDINLNLRGNPESLGEIVPRRFPIALSHGKTIPLNEGSGRLQLAEAVAHHPLAARVAVNRIWLALFGQGLVRTPSNFGALGDRPALPELLEYLAARFVQQGYSVKAMIREIVLSDAYMRSSDSNAANAKLDPDNRYLWRQSRRRLQAEPFRDALLAVSGELDRTVGGESKPLNSDFRRTIYAKMSRFQQEETLSLFDLPSALVTCEQRAVTNVPLQMLFFLNSEEVTARASAFAKRVMTAAPEEGIRRAYRLLFDRMPTAKEMQLGGDFLRDGDAETWKRYARVLLSSNEFAYVD